MPDYQFMPQLMLRAPYYGYRDYDLLRLPEVLADPVFRNAVALASPVFFEQLAKKNFEFGNLNGKERHTLAKYYNRMSFRPTPFGAFATFSLLDWGDGSQVRLGEAQLHLRPDQKTIHALDQVYRKDPGSTLVLNPILYPAGTAYRFIRSFPDGQGHYRFSLDTIARNPFHTELFALLREQALRRPQLADRIRELTACTAGEAEDYADFLQEAGLLFGPEQGHIICPGTDLYADLAHTLPAGGDLPTGGPAIYAATERPLQEGQPDEETRAALLPVLDALARLSGPAEPAALARFIGAFSERYDRQKVPLPEALDPDTGIPYADLETGGGRGSP